MHFQRRSGKYSLLDLTEHLHGIFMMQNRQRFRICWPLEQSSSSVGMGSGTIGCEKAIS